MITMYVARTLEIDDFDAAMDEIKSQIDFSAFKKNLAAFPYGVPSPTISILTTKLCKPFVMKNRCLLGWL